MKKLYWRPQRISLRLLLLVAGISIVGLLFVEGYQVKEKQPYHAEKIRAARLALQAFNVIKQERLKRGHPIDIESDPAETGVIGELLTSVTTNPGHLPSKQTSVNPNFAAVIVRFLKRAGVEEGDVVAVGVSGSFPAINISLFAALATIKAEPVIITSTGSSQWGANLPDFMWPDMERVLQMKNIFPYRSIALSRGGIDDRALGLTKKSRKMLDNVIERNRLPKLDVKNYKDSVEQRMHLYLSHAGEKDIKAYVNVGGGTTSVGTKVGKRMFKPGLNRTAPRGPLAIDSVMTRFAQQETPVIHLTKINQLAERYGLPIQPAKTPPVGDGKIFYKEVRSRLLALIVLGIIILTLVGFVRLDWGYRLVAGARREKGSSKPEQMV